MTSFSPGLILILGAVAVPFLRGVWRSAFMLALPLVGLALVFALEPGHYWQLPFLGHELTLVRVDRLANVFGIIFFAAAALSVLYALQDRDPVQQVATLVYSGSAIGAVYAGDLITLFVFWEITAISSVFLIWARRTERAYRAGMRYLIIQVVSGVLLLAGALVHYYETGSLAFEFIGLEGISGWLIFIAFGIKCAFPFLHNWLTDAYPEATPTGTVFLSAFTTKVAVYALARGFPGTELLVYIGAIMTCFPIFYAVIENDLRRVLAYSMINQIGFMVCGVGIGTALALNGAVAHAFNDVIFKGLLFMTMGAVLYRAGNINGSDLGGMYKSMPKTALLCIVGASSISAFPLFSGFVSKSMVMTAMIEEGYNYLWLMLLFASAGVFHHAGIKIPYFAFFHHDAGIRTKEAPGNMLIAMTIAAILCIFIGSQPQYLYALLPWEVDYWPYDTTHVLAQLQLLFFSALAFVWLNKQGLYPPELHSVNIDAEWLYRKLLPVSAGFVRHGVPQLAHSLRDAVKPPLRRMREALVRWSMAEYHLASQWPTGSMVLWIAVLLGGFLVLDAIH